MTLEQVIEQAKTQEIQYPYCDWNWLRALPADVMHALGIGMVTPEDRIAPEVEATIGPGYVDHIPEFVVQRWLAARRFSAWVKAIQAKNAKDGGTPVHDLTGVNKALISKMNNGVRHFCVPSERLEVICHKLMGISVHDLLFGEEQDMLLPQPVNDLVVELLKLDDEPKIRLAAEAKIMERAFMRAAMQMEHQEDHYRTMAKLFVERSHWIMNAERNHVAYAFGKEKTPNQLKSALPKVFLRERGADPQLQFICEVALITEYPVDFFVCERFIGHTRIKVKTDDGIEFVDDPEVLQFLESLFLLDEERIEVLMTKAWTAVFTEKFYR